MHFSSISESHLYDPKKTFNYQVGLPCYATCKGRIMLPHPYQTGLASWYHCSFTHCICRVNSCKEWRKLLHTLLLNCIAYCRKPPDFCHVCYFSRHGFYYVLGLRIRPFQWGQYASWLPTLFSALKRHLTDTYGFFYTTQIWNPCRWKEP